MPRDLAFISYSHLDAKWLKWLQILLAPYLAQGRLVLWADPYIKVGDDFERTIDKAMKRARVGVLLVSHNFAASPFIRNIELASLRAAAERGELTLFPIPVSSQDPEILGLDRCNWVRSPQKPLDKLSVPARNEALTELALRLVACFQDGSPESAPQNGTPKVPPMTPRTVEPLRRDATRLGEIHGVPKLPRGFVGRDAELGKLKAALLNQAKPSFGISAAIKAGVHGQGGLGKTVLATAIAHEDGVRRAFPDGIYWITLGQEPDLIALQKKLLVLVANQREEVQSIELGLMALRKALWGKRCLLILDDVWRRTDAAALDAQGPQGRLLVTTRDREVLTGMGAVTLPLGVLSPPAARKLLARWARVPPESLSEDAAQVAEACGYLPLALAVAGAMVADRTPWKDLLAALRAGHGEFLDHAHGNVFASLALSVRDQEAEEAARYLDLGIFPEDVAIPEAVVVRLWTEAGLNADDARQLLERFASKSLLTRVNKGKARVVRMHDLQGDYVRLVAEDIEGAHARLLNAYRQTLPAADTESARWAGLPKGRKYLWRNLLHHALGAGQAALADALVSDVRWLSARIEVLGTSSLLTELTALVARAPSKVNRQIQRALLADAGWLHGHPEALPGLLYNRLRSGGLTAEAVEARMGGVRPRIRLVHPVRFGDGRVFRGHSSHVTDCAYSPDGLRVLSASEDNTLREWDRATGQELMRFTGHGGVVTACAYAPDGLHVLSASGDKTLREWDRASGREVMRFEGHSGGVTACAYAPDGLRVLSASDDKTLGEWDRATGQEVMRFEGHSGGVTACAYAPDGLRVLSASDDKTLREWDRATGREVMRFEGHSGQATACAYAPDGLRILSSSKDKTLREWDRVTGKEVRRFGGHVIAVTACAYSPDGLRVVSGSWDATLREWDRATGQEVKRFEGHSSFVQACAYAPDGLRIVSASWDNTLREWDRTTGKKTKRFKGHSLVVTACAYAPNGLRVLSASNDNTLREWDRATGKATMRFEGHSLVVTACAYSPDGLRILSASWDNTLREWDRATGKTTRDFKGHSDLVTACAYAPDGLRILSASWDNTLREWDRATGKTTQRFKGHSNWVAACAYAPDGLRILSASRDNTLREWDCATGREVMRFVGHSLWVTACAYAPDGLRILSGAVDGMLCEWDRESGKPTKRFKGHSGLVTACVYAPGGVHVVSASEDQTLRIWCRSTGQCLDTLYGTAAFNCIAVAPGGIVAGDKAGNLWFLACDWF